MVKFNDLSETIKKIQAFDFLNYRNKKNNIQKEKELSTPESKEHFRRNVKTAVKGRRIEITPFHAITLLTLKTLVLSKRWFNFRINM